MKKQIKVIYEKCSELGIYCNESDAHDIWIAIKESFTYSDKEIDAIEITSTAGELNGNFC